MEELRRKAVNCPEGDLEALHDELNACIEHLNVTLNVVKGRNKTRKGSRRAEVKRR